MPKLLFARQAQDQREQGRIHKLARSRNVPGDVMMRAKMITASWAGKRTSRIAIELGCHPQTVRERLQRFNEEGLEGWIDRPRSGRQRRITEAERSLIISLVNHTPPGRMTRQGEGSLRVADETGSAHWTLDSLTAAAQQRGIAIKRSQVRRILQAEGVAWRGIHTWAASSDPEFAPKGPRS
jgi:transposase